MTGSSSEQHRKKAAAATDSIGVAIVTVSDSRTPETDVNGHYLRTQIIAGGHQVVAYRLIKDEPDQVAAVLEEMSQSPAQIVLFNGGTGISPRDRTFDVLDRHLEKRLPGFGELFRMLSWEQVGAAAMLSRATAGVYKNRVIISTPGSPKAVQLAWEKLVAPELAHLAWEVVK